MRTLWLATPLLLTSVLLALVRAPAGEAHAAHQSRDKCHHCPDDLLADPTVPDDYADFWDGSWDSNEPRDENGDGVQENTRVWTGSKSDCQRANPYFYIGSVLPAYGDQAVHCTEIRQWSDWRALQYRAYGITKVFRVGP